MAEQTIRLAIAEAGAISEYHLKGWRAQHDVEIVAICDTNLSNAVSQAARHDIPLCLTDTATLLDTVEPDTVDIIAPVGSHATLVRQTADRGVHVVYQKPMTPTVAEALIADVGERVRFTIRENYRFRPHYHELAQRVRAGAVGKLRHARIRRARLSRQNDVSATVPAQPRKVQMPFGIRSAHTSSRRAPRDSRRDDRSKRDA